MKLSFDEISETGRQYSIDDCSWFPGDGEQFSLDVTARVWLIKRDLENVVVEGEIKGVRAATCDRCGEAVRQDLQCQFEYLATTRKEEVSNLPETECSEEDATTLYLEEPVIDVDEILREQMFLELPLRTLCRENCKGICAGCGASLNTQECKCSPDNPNSPFAILGELKKKSN